MSHTPPGRTRERIFRYVREQLLAGRPPTVREVQEAFGFRAPASAREQLEALVAEGRLTKDAGRSRGYRLPGRGAGAVLIPLLGRVQAGALAEAVEEAEGFVAVSAAKSRGDLFALRVRGDSMRDAGILDGDVVIVRRQARAENGQIVVALVADSDNEESGVTGTVREGTVREGTVPEATVKTLRLRPERGGKGRGGNERMRVELHPANPDFQPIVPPPSAVSILGVVIEVRREITARREIGQRTASEQIPDDRMSDDDA